MGFTITFEEENFSQVYEADDEFDFDSEFSDLYNSNCLFVAQFTPFLSHSDHGRFERIIFNNLYIDTKIISIYSFNNIYQVDMPVENLQISISIMNQHDVFPSVLNRPISLPYDTCSYAIFYEGDSDTKLLCFNSGRFSNIHKMVKKTLKDNHLGDIDIQIKHVSDEDSDFIPLDGLGNLIELLSAKRTMTLVVKSVDSFYAKMGPEVFKISLMSQVPRAILKWCLDHLNNFGANSAKIRRLAAISANGGIPVSLISSLSNFPVGSNGFESTGICFSDCERHLDHVSQNSTITYFCNNISNFTTWSSSEATLRSLVWDSLISVILLEEERLLPFDVISEFNLSKCLGCDTRRKADIALVDKELKLPLLIVELGKDNPIRGQTHKDFTKLLCAMTAACIHLCNKMRAEKKDPNAARVYGLWIGNTTFHCIIAHPKFTSCPNFKRTEIHVILTFHEHWNSNLLSGPEIHPCTGACCSSNQIIPGTLSDSAILERIPDSINQTIDVTLEEENDQLSEQSQGQGQQQSQESRSRSHVSNMAICKLKTFLDLVKETRTLISTSTNVNFDESYPYPFTKPERALISSFWASNSTETPTKEQFAKGHKRKIVDPTKTPTNPKKKTFSIAKRAIFEVNFYNFIRSSKSSIFFPRLYSCVPTDDKNSSFRFTFEHLYPLFDGNNGLNYSIIQNGEALDILLEAIVYGIHSLFQLSILHEEFMVVHSDISYNNIMYSSDGDMWKLIDFNLAMPLEESLKIPRSAGTPDFIAPESLSSKIFSFESDVYSLGRILLNCWYLHLILICELGDENVPQSVEEAMSEFHAIIVKMLSKRPSDRISVRSALKLLHSLLIKYKHATFKVKGHTTIMVLIESGLFEEFKFDSRDDVLMTEIITNNNF